MASNDVPGLFLDAGCSIPIPIYLCMEIGSGFLQTKLKPKQKDDHVVNDPTIKNLLGAPSFMFF
jgi:hypothetical protein